MKSGKTGGALNTKLLGEDLDKIPGVKELGIDYTGTMHLIRNRDNTDWGGPIKDAIDFVRYAVRIDIGMNKWSAEQTGPQEILYSVYMNRDPAFIGPEGTSPDEIRVNVPYKIKKVNIWGKDLYAIDDEKWRFAYAVSANMSNKDKADEIKKATGIILLIVPDCSKDFVLIENSAKGVPGVSAYNLAGNGAGDLDWGSSKGKFTPSTNRGFAISDTYQLGDNVGINIWWDLYWSITLDGKFQPDSDRIIFSSTNDPENEIKLILTNENKLEIQLSNNNVIFHTLPICKTGGCSSTKTPILSTDLTSGSHKLIINYTPIIVGNIYIGCVLDVILNGNIVYQANCTSNIFATQTSNITLNGFFGDITFTSGSGETN